MVGKNSNKFFLSLNYFPGNLDWFLICWFLTYFINSSVLSPGTLRILKKQNVKIWKESSTYGKWHCYWVAFHAQCKVVCRLKLNISRRSNSMLTFLFNMQPEHLVHRDLDIKFRSSPRQVFLGKAVLKTCSKFTGEHPCRNVI